MSRGHRIAVAAPIVIAGLMIDARAEPATPQPVAPSAGAVVVSMRAVSRDGQPVVGLQAGDVEVVVDGRPVPVSAVHPQAPATTPATPALPPRRLVVVVNRPTMTAGGGRHALERLAAFLEQLPPSEWAAVWPIPAVRPQLVLTGDRAITRAALLAASGTRPVSIGRFTLSPQDALRIARGDQMLLDMVAERECSQTGGARDDVARCREELRRDALAQAEQASTDAQQASRELQLLVGALGRVPGLKHVIVVTGGVGLLREQAAAVRTIAADAAAAGITIHAIQVSQPGGREAGGRGADESLEMALARSTGGVALAGGDVQAALVRLGRELAGEYVCVLAPDNAARDGQVHDLEVRVLKGPAVNVSAPRHLRFARAQEAPAPVSPPAEAVPAATPSPEPQTAVTPAPPAAPGIPPAASPAAPGVDSGLASMPLQTLLLRVADYGRRYEKEMATVVIEERYVQLLKRWSLPPKAADAERLAWLPGSGAPDRLDVNVYQRRQIRADLLLVQLPDHSYQAFRDILEVNGREQRGRDDRLRKLFLQQTDDSHRQLHRINRASADMNLGSYYREINLPTVGLMILQARHQPRFSFKTGPVDRVGDAACRQIAFTETSKPTLVRTLEEKDVPLVGSACVDADGIVWRTRIETDGRITARGVVEVTYGPHERVDVLVPRTMWEWYLPVRQDDQRGPVFIEALATYSNLRQFSVTTDQIVK